MPLFRYYVIQMPLFRYYVIQVRPVFNSAAIVLYCAAMLKNVRPELYVFATNL